MVRMTLMRIAGAVLTTGMLGAGSALADDYVLTIKDHQFAPALLEVPAGEAFDIIVRNQDDTPEEFESVELDREKIVPGGGEIRVRIDALSPGKYDYYGEFHMDTAFGQIVAK